MASRYPGAGGLQHRDPRSSTSGSLFDGYPGSGSSGPRPGSQSPLPRGYGLNSSPYADANGNANTYLAPGANGSAGSGFRSGTPDSKGRHSTALLDHLESQNDSSAQTSMLTSKVRQLKELTVAIGDEIRDSSAFADTMNDQFENTRVRLRGTMNRMLRMAERTGVGWKVWLGFFVFVWCLFAYVWLF